jgi:hypothetical protein
MPVIEVRFKLEKETKGALRYQEVDEKGEVIEQACRPWRTRSSGPGIWCFATASTLSGPPRIDRLECRLGEVEVRMQSGGFQMSQEASTLFNPMAKLIFVHGLIGTGFWPNPQRLLIDPGLKSKTGWVMTRY